MQPIITTTPFQMISVDFLHLETSTGGCQYIFTLGIISRDTLRLMQLKTSLRKQMQKDIQRLYFTVWTLRNLDNLIGFRHSRTTPYHPQGNGQHISMRLFSAVSQLFSSFIMYIV